MRPDQEYIYNFSATEKPLSTEERAVFDHYENNPEDRAMRDRPWQFIQMDKFNDIYGRNIVSSDKRIVTEHYRENKKDFNARGMLMEFFISQAETADWFGENCSIHRSSKYDDIKNYTDLVFEWEDKKGEVARLAVDCTINSDEFGLDEKSEGIMRKLYRGELSSLKYHQPESTEEKREIKQVPQVLMILDSEKIKELSEIFSRVIKKEPGSKNQFSESHIQLVLLEEVNIQLGYQLSELKKVIVQNRDDKFRINAQKSIEKVLDIVRTLIKEKKSSLDKKEVQRANEVWSHAQFCAYLRNIPQIRQNRLSFDANRANLASA